MNLFCLKISLLLTTLIHNSVEEQLKKGTTNFDHPIVSQVYDLWRKWLPKEGGPSIDPAFTGYLTKSKSVNDPCTVSPEEDASLAYIRVFLGDRKTRPHVNGLTFDHNPHRFLAGTLLFFLRHTANLKPTNGNLNGTYCNNDYESDATSIFTESFDDTMNKHSVYSNFNPPALVCFEDHCERCNHSGVIYSEACKTLQTPLNNHTFTFSEDGRNSLSDEKFPNWTTIFRMTPQEFRDIEKTNSDLLNRDHHIVKHMLKVWTKWVSMRDNKSVEICEVSDEEQLALASVETLLGMSDPEDHLARNFMFYVKQTEKYTESNQQAFCGKGQACFRGKCIDCGKVSETMTNSKTKEVPSKLYLSCVLTDPAKEGRLILPRELPTTTPIMQTTPDEMDITNRPVRKSRSLASNLNTNTFVNKFQQQIHVLIILLRALVYPLVCELN